MRSAIIVKDSVAMVMHLLLFWVHMCFLKIDIPNAFDLFYPRIVALVIVNIAIVADCANSAVSLRQPNNKIQEIHSCRSSDKVIKWMHFVLSILMEMCDIAWFIMKCNMMHQYVTYLTRRSKQGENICKMINNDLTNNKYTRKLRKGAKDTNFTYLLVLGVAIIVNLATTDRSIIRTIKWYGIQIHFAFLVIVHLETACFTTSFLIKKLRKSMRNKVNYIAFDVPAPDIHYPICTQTDEMYSLLTADEIQAVTNSNMQTKQGDKTEHCKFNSDATYNILTEQLLLHSLYLSQIPPYVFKHNIYIKRYVSFASLKCSRSLLQCYRCNSQLHLPIANVSNDANTDDRQYFYQMTSKPHGISIIINNENFKISLKSRSGSDSYR